MVMKIEVIGLDKVDRLLRNLPKSIQKEVGEGATRKIAISGQRRIKFRYNVLGYGRSEFSTGTGLRSISIKKSPGGYSVFVADYLVLLNKPIRTHWVSMETIEAHQAHPGSTMFRKAPSGFPFTRPPILFVWKGPFITPAIMGLRSDIPKILEKSIAKAIALAAK